LRDVPAASGTDVVIAATMAPVSSNAFCCSVIAARITALCHSNGIASLRTQSRQYFIVSSTNLRPTSSTALGTVSSGPRSSVSESPRKNGRSSRMAVSDPSVVSRSVKCGST
jgi:hypothetical protein